LNITLKAVAAMRQPSLLRISGEQEWFPVAAKIPNFAAIKNTHA